MINLKLNIDKKKLEALEYYMPDDKCLDDELSSAARNTVDKTIDKLYVKYVPRNVRDFIENKGKIKSVTVTQHRDDSSEYTD